VFYFVLVTALVAFVMSYHLLAPVILAFILTILITLAVNPVVLWVRSIMGGRTIATAVVTLVFVGGLALAIYAFVVPIKTSAAKLVQRVPEYWEQVQRPLIKLEKKAAASEAKLESEVAQEVAESAEADGDRQQAQLVREDELKEKPAPAGSFRTWLSGMFQGAAGSFKSVAYSTAEMVVVLVTVFFGVVFTLMNPRPIFGFIFALVPAEHHDQALRIFRRISEFVPNWALATLLGMLTIGLLVFLLMWPIFGFMDALILGVTAGLLEAVPYLGPTLSAVPALLLALGKGGMTPVWVLLAYILVQALENNVVLPLIMARGMKLHPVAVIFSMLLCVLAFGVLGVLIAAPMVAIVQILHDELFRSRFLPNVGAKELDTLARKAMREIPPA
jgi:predicted PurR-regulated permease PerM